MDSSSMYERLLGEDADDFLRRASLNLAIYGFLTHLLLCILYQLNILEIDSNLNTFFDSFLDSLYTPFSVILAYEVYELIRAIPDSFSNSVGKQFEVVCLLIVRDIFKNLSEIDSAGSLSVDSSIAFLAVECVAFLVLFFTALLFRSFGSKTNNNQDPVLNLKTFVQQKKNLAMVLFVVYVCVALYSLSSWTWGVVEGDGSVSRTVFFLDFFTCLIMADILILLVSYRSTTDFPNLARNTGFILSTVVLRVAIGTTGFSGATLFILGGGLGMSVLLISQFFQVEGDDEKREIASQQS
ncbi:MAG: hypothetical protein OSA38_02575 [Candidatus Poseidoniaceae archaeon]|nr:hypothetical protein [Candidatus Poseidoniaceae archaeon]|tara:strand:+ start:198 stop:1088 length:891 start_codon:yes stop_codon:yes gene_type:complete